MSEERGGRGRGGKGGDKDKNKDGPRRGGGFFRRRRVCKFCAEKIDYINYKDVRCWRRSCPSAARSSRGGSPARAPCTSASSDRDQARAAAGARAVRHRLSRFQLWFQV